jgi:hypothetical protein
MSKEKTVYGIRPKIADGLQKVLILFEGKEIETEHRLSLWIPM